LADTNVGLRLREEEEQRLLFANQNQLNLNPSLGVAARAVDESGPDIPPAIPGFVMTEIGGVVPTFENQIGDPQDPTALPVGTGNLPGQSTPQALFDVGGPQALQESQRPSGGFGIALGIAQTLGGKTTGTQRADPIHLNPMQRVMLGIADVIAISQGNQMPSVTLNQQIDRAELLEIQNNRQALVSGMKFMFDIAKFTSMMPPEDRVAAVASMVEVMEKLLPGSGALGLTIASNKTEGDVLAEFVKNPDNFRGTELDQVLNFAGALAFVNPDKARGVIDAALNGGAGRRTVDSISPTIFQALLPAQIEAGRQMRGEMAEFANKLVAGTEVTPEQYAVWHSKLPEKLKADPVYLESLVRSPENQLNVFPGFTLAELVALRKKKEVEGEFSSQVAMINMTPKDPNKPEIIGGPELGERVRNLGSNWTRIGLNHDALFGGDSGSSGLFGPLSPAGKTEFQKGLIELRQTADELVGIDEVFSGDLLTASARIENAFLSFESFFTGELSPEDAKFKREFIQLRTQAVTSLSATLNRLSGAAVSPQEFERIKQTRPAPDDNPADFKIKLDTAIGLTMFSIARAHVWEMSGDESIKYAMNLTREGVRDFIRAKGQALQEAYRNNYPQFTENQQNAAVQRDLAKAFGIRPKDLIGILSADPTLTLAGDPNATPQELEKIKPGE